MSTSSARVSAALATETGHRRVGSMLRVGLFSDGPNAAPLVILLAYVVAQLRTYRLTGAPIPEPSGS